MERQIVLKKRYINNLLKLLTYLKAEWGEKVTTEFIARLDKRLLDLLSQPNIGNQNPQLSKNAFRISLEK